MLPLVSWSETYAFSKDYIVSVCYFWM